MLKYKFSNREIILLLIAVMLGLGLIYYSVILKSYNENVTKYDTTSLKSKIKTDESDDISRAFELYVNYMPTFTNSAASKTGYYRIIVEIKHDNVDIVEIKHDNVDSDKKDAYYYTYANIEVR